MECYLLSESKIREYRERMLSLWMQKSMFWVSEQRLVDPANTISRNSWMTELEMIQELERKVAGSDSVTIEETRTVEALPDHVGEDVRNILPETGAEVQADSLDEEVATVMEIAEVTERGRKDKLLALEMCQRRNY